MDIAYQRFTLGAEITDEQQAFFYRNGYIHFKNFIRQETVADFIRASEQVEQNWIANKVEKITYVKHYNPPAGTRRECRIRKTFRR